MGFYIRKSISLGPLRFNLSKSGIGVSGGFRGFRVGTGPRGNYIHIGAGGFYYRRTIASPNSAKTEATNITPQQPSGPQSATHGDMQEISSGSISRMADSNAIALLTELDSKKKQLRLTPFVSIASILLAAFLLWIKVPAWLTIIVTVICAAIVIFAYYWDMLKKSVVLMYELEPEAEEAYERLYTAINKLATVGAVWNIQAKGNVYDSKYHAGASHLVRRHRITVSEREPTFVRTNLSIGCLPVTKGELFFFPDTILFYTSDGVGAVGYDDIQLEHSATRFIEAERVPHDAKVVDRTWRYVNKNGGPDRRFNNNSEIPVCEYEEIRLQSISGLKEHFQASRIGVAVELKHAIQRMALSLAQARTGEANRLAKIEKEELEPAESKPVNSIYEAIFQILCCLMVSDGRISPKEKSKIFEIMSTAGSSWSEDAFSQKLSDFIKDVQRVGFQSVLDRVLPQVLMFKSIGKGDVLVRCVDLVASADGVKSEAELRLVRMIREMLDMKAQNTL